MLIFDFVIGLMGVVFGIILFAGGFFFGIWVEKSDKRTTKVSMSEEEKKKHAEQVAAQNAFEEQMRYNADIAYGIDSLFGTGGDI